MFINQGLDKHLGPGMFYPENLKSLRFRESGIQYVEEAGYTVLRQRYIRVVSNCWTGLWTGSLDWIAGLDCWTGLLDWILNKDVRLACKTACVVKAYASQGHTDVVETQNQGARFTINLNKATNYAAKLTKPTARK